MKKQTQAGLERSTGNEGFALPIAIGLGLMTVLIGATMVVRSHGDQVTASAQKATASSLSVAEVGVTQVQTFLNKYRGYASVPYPWTGYLNSLVNSCTPGNDFYDSASAFDGWITVGGGIGQFKVISYQPPATPAGNGILVIQGRALQGTTIRSTTQLQVSIPVLRTAIPLGPAPGAWAQNFGLGNNRIQGNVIDAACTPGSISNAERANISGTVTNDPSMILPPPLPVPNDAISLSAITSGTTIFPRTGDTPNASSEYVYRIGKNGNGDSINLQGNNDKVLIKPGQKVTFYLDGNIQTQGGQVKVGHDCTDTNNPPDGVSNGTTIVTGCEPTNFQIFGGVNTTSIVFGGSNTVDAFIFAPKAEGGVNGSAQLRGSAWLKEWDLANGNHIVIVQTANWNKVPASLLPPTLGSTNSWQRQQIP